MWFRFAERSDIGEYVQNISKRLRSPFVPRDLILREPCLAEDLDPEHVSTILESMRPELGRVVVVSNDVDHVAPKGEWEKEKWYGTEYKVIKTDDGLLQKVSISKRQTSTACADGN
jgi:insulysin